MKSILVFQTDFTYKEGAVCAMYGVVKSVDRELEIIDGTHELPQFDIWSASYRLYQSMKFWPEGTIFISVVDPGVGTSRRACVAKTTDGYYVVTPDNGSLTHVKSTVGITEIRVIDESINRLRGKGTDEVSVFHGRDLFAYCAARLASGIISFGEVGPVYELDSIVMLPLEYPDFNNKTVSGIFEINDPNFGNIWTNIPQSLFRTAGFLYGDLLNLKVINDGKPHFDIDIVYQPSFGYVKQGEPVLYTNELMNIGLAISMGNAIERYRLGYGAGWKVQFRKV